MKKTIFEGTINGVKFDNVQDYNVEMQRCLAEGIAVQATSATKTVEETVEQKQAPVAQPIDANHAMFYPGFEHCFETPTPHFDERFVDEIVGRDEDSILRGINYALNNVTKLLILLPQDELKKYKSRIDDVLEYIFNRDGHYEKDIEQLEERRLALEEEHRKVCDDIKTLEKRWEIIRHLADMYQSISENVIEKISDEIEVPKGSGLDSINPVGKSIEDNTNHILEDLFKAFGLDPDDKQVAESANEVRNVLKDFFEGTTKNDKTINEKDNNFSKSYVAGINRLCKEIFG